MNERTKLFRLSEVILGGVCPESSETEGFHPGQKSVNNCDPNSRDIHWILPLNHVADWLRLGWFFCVPPA